METIDYTCVPSFTSVCIILGSEEVILNKLPEAIICWWLSWKQFTCVPIFTCVCAILSKFEE